MDGEREAFQSPQRGLFISYATPVGPMAIGDAMRFSPLSGDCLFLTTRCQSQYQTKEKGFSPLSGDCLFLTHDTDRQFARGKQGFQSPQRGLFISYYK